MRTLVGILALSFVALALLLGGNVPVPWPGAGPSIPETPAGAVPERWAVVCDRSDSGLGHACTPAWLTRQLRAWLRASLDRPGSAFKVWICGRSFDTAAETFEAKVPANWGPGVARARQRFIEQTLQRLGAVALPSGHSAIAETVVVAAGWLHEDSSAQGALHVASDLRQVSAGLDFEHSVPRDPAEFVSLLRSRGHLATLRDIRLSVCGVHNQAGPHDRHHGARDDLRIRAAWRAVFQASGASGPVPIVASCEDGPDRVPAFSPAPPRGALR